MNLITSVATTAAPVPDAVMTEPVHDMLDAASLAPGEHAADAEYAGADQLLAAQARNITLLAPLAADALPAVPHRRLHRRHVHHRLGASAGDLSPRRPQSGRGISHRADEVGGLAGWVNPE